MLADIADLIDLSGNSYSDDQVWRLTTLLNVASREIQIYVGQKIERLTHTWNPRYANRLVIPEGPDASITSVKDYANNDVNYVFDGYNTLWLQGPGVIPWNIEVGNPMIYTTMRVTVVYDAGYDIVPPDIKSVCCQMALRAFGMDATKSGMTQEAITNYSYQQGQAAAAGAIGMLPLEQDALKRYRKPRGPISMRKC